jgi:hypothetical protein
MQVQSLATIPGIAFFSEFGHFVRIPVPWIEHLPDVCPEQAFALSSAAKVLGNQTGTGFNTMRRANRSLLLALLVPASLVSVSAVVEAAQAKATRWSDPASWPNKKVPAAGDKVTIDSGKDVVLDVSPPALGGLTINGKLSFANTADLELTTEWVMIHGELAIGTEAAPHTR